MEESNKRDNHCDNDVAAAVETPAACGAENEANHPSNKKRKHNNDEASAEIYNGTAPFDAVVMALEAKDAAKRRVEELHEELEKRELDAEKLEDQYYKALEQNDDDDTKDLIKKRYELALGSIQLVQTQLDGAILDEETARHGLASACEREHEQVHEKMEQIRLKLSTLADLIFQYVDGFDTPTKFNKFRDRVVDFYHSQCDDN